VLTALRVELQLVSKGRAFDIGGLYQLLSDLMYVISLNLAAPLGIPRSVTSQSPS
jgi:hypothetical protein